MSEESQEQWAIVIDTDSYSGNFEREMAAYITGQRTIRGENFVHDFEAAFEEEDPFEDLFVEWPGEHGYELAHIHPTPGWGNNGRGDHKKLSDLSVAKRKKYTWPAYQSVIIRCNEKPSQVQIEILKEWANKFAAKSREPKVQRGFDENMKNPFHYIQPLNIIGFRLICEKTVTETIVITL
jgi:hypothetical protein